MAGVDRRRADHDRRAVLVIVKDRYVHPFAAQFFDDEAVGCLDVLKVDRSERWLQRGDDINKLFGVGLVHFQIETVDIGEFLEQDGLAFHYRFGCERPDIAKAKHGRAVTDHRHQVALRGVTRGG